MSAGRLRGEGAVIASGQIPPSRQPRPRRHQHGLVGLLRHGHKVVAQTRLHETVAGPREVDWDALHHAAVVEVDFWNLAAGAQEGT